MVIDGKHQTTASAQTFTVTTVGGKAFTVFAKNKQWAQELYEDFVAPTLNDGLLVESWMNGVGRVRCASRPTLRRADADGDADRIDVQTVQGARH